MSARGFVARLLSFSCLRPVQQNDEALVDALLARLGAGGGRVFSVAPAAASDGGAVDGADGGSSRLLEHLGWPCTLRTALLVSITADFHELQQLLPMHLGRRSHPQTHAAVERCG